MANTYFKILGNKIEEQQRESITSGIQRDLMDSCKNIHFGTEVLDAALIKATKDIDINNLLKYYILNQIIKEETKENIDESYETTSNPYIRKDIKKNQYYKYQKKALTGQEKITDVNEDGSYTTIENKYNTKYTIKKLYIRDDSIVSIQVYNAANRLITDSWQAAQILGMKKEYAEKYKYAGYSGNSSDFCASVLNKISGHKETGYYMDSTYNFYIWDKVRNAFINRPRLETSSPYLTDYDFKENTVIRKEYKGVK